MVKFSIFFLYFFSSHILINFILSFSQFVFLFRYYFSFRLEGGNRITIKENNIMIIVKWLYKSCNWYYALVITSIFLLFSENGLTFLNFFIYVKPVSSTNHSHPLAYWRENLRWPNCVPWSLNKRGKIIKSHM